MIDPTSQMKKWRSTFASQNVKNLEGVGAIFKRRCGKMARRCGAKRICKSKFKRVGVQGKFGSYDVQKWHAAVQSTLARQNVQNTACSDYFLKFPDVEKSHTAVERSTCVSQNVQNTACSDHFLKFRCRKIAHRYGTKHICKSKCTTF